MHLLPLGFLPPLPVLYPHTNTPPIKESYTDRRYESILVADSTYDMVWERRRCSSSPEGAGTFPQHGRANAPKEGNEFSILGIVYFPPLGNPDKTKG